MNPARTLGPALAMNDLNYLWMYFVGPLAGGGRCGFALRSLFLVATEKPPVEAAESLAGRGDRHP